MISSESPTKTTQKIPGFTYVFFVWIAIAIASLIINISLIDNGVQKRFVDKLYTAMQENPTDSQYKDMYNRANDSFTTTRSVALVKTILEGLGLVLTAALLIFRKKDIGIGIGFFSVIAGLIMDFLAKDSNILFVNILGFILLLVLVKQYKKKEIPTVN